jgi:hypothetical protein
LIDNKFNNEDFNFILNNKSIFLNIKDFKNKFYEKTKIEKYYFLNFLCNLKNELIEYSEN